MTRLCPLLAACLTFTLSAPSFPEEKPMTIGIIGLDTSHAPAFTKLINDAKDPEHIPGGKVICAYPGGSADIPDSVGRVDQFTRDMHDKYGVEILGSVEAVVA